MFIVIEGIDGAGTGTQALAVAERLKQKGLKAETQEFPDHSHPLYQSLIHPAMHKEITFRPGELFLLFLTDQLRFREKIFFYKGTTEKIFLADRYFTTNLVYNCCFLDLEGLLAMPVSGGSEALTVDQAVDLAKNLDLAIPDLVIFLEVSPQVAVQRKRQEDGHEEGLDRFEASIKTQEIIQTKYHYLIDRSVLCPWVVVGGEGSVEEVAGRIIGEIEARNRT
jgi:thymidylate kinase